jgi:hypothetical protein
MEFNFLEKSNQQVNDDYRDEMNVAKQQKLVTFPFTNNLIRPINNNFDGQDESTNYVAPIRSHRLQIRDGSLKFRLNDGNLRIGRGFGKRSGESNEKYAKISFYHVPLESQRSLFFWIKLTYIYFNSLLVSKRCKISGDFSTTTLGSSVMMSNLISSSALIYITDAYEIEDSSSP